MKLLNIVLAIVLGTLLYNQASARDDNTVACRIVSIDEKVIIALKKRISPF